MELIHNEVKMQLKEYACKINEAQDLFLIIIKFGVMLDNERILFNVNGKHSVKDTVDEAICYLDGIMIAVEFFNLYSE